MQPPSIRKAVMADRESIHAAHMRSIREVCVKDHGPEEIRGWGNRDLGERWIDGIRNGLVWVVEQGVSIGGVGCIGVLAQGSSAHVHALYLTPELLGRGLGRDLMRLMLDEARARDVSEVTLDSTITAHAFYKRFGFEDAGPAVKTPIGGWPVTSIPMRLVLSVPSVASR